MPTFMPVRVMDKLQNFETRPDDTFVVTYPKSGTTWAEQMMLLVRHDGDVTKLEGKHVMKLVPFLDIVRDADKPKEAVAIIDLAEAMPSPRILKTHSPSDWLPEALHSDEPEVKVVYVARNPKDVAVSYYHFCHYIPDLPSYETWDVFFEEYLAGRAPQGSWFQNVLPWWERRHHPNVLFLKYEDMKRDLPGSVRQIARFMGKSLSDDVIHEIASGSTFSAMKKNPSANPDFILDKANVDANQNVSFMRKGTVGDWKNYFSVDQNRRFDELYKNEMAGSGLEMDFELSA